PCAGKQSATYQHGAAHSRAERQHDHISPPASSAPEYFGDQRSAGVILRRNGQIAGIDHIAQQLTFEEMEIPRQAFHPGRARINDSLASNPDPFDRKLDRSQNRMDEVAQGRGGTRRGLMKALA